MVKLMDAVQRQRTVLSANNEHHLSLEYILNEEDLTYNMHREELENIIVPVLGDIAAAMAAIQSRNCSIPLHAVELMGGASRIPCIQAMAAKIFGVEPSRSLNQSEAIATGSTILGAVERKVLNLQYTYDAISTKEIAIRWGKQRHCIFNARTKAPSETTLNIGKEGTI
jgi:molecular chaperone DnaK (HSP70)